MDIVQTLNTNKPSMRNGFDAMVAALHLTMRQSGFRCIGLTENGSNNSNVDDQTPLPDGWNQSFDSYSFQYKHTQSSMTFFVKYLIMNNKLLVHGIAKEDNKICSLELSLNDYVNEDSLSDYNALYKDLDKLIALFKINIISKLLPDLNKAGYEATAEQDTPTSTRTPQREQVHPYDFERPQVHDPLRIPGTGGHYPSHFPSFGVGYNDLHPPFPGVGAPSGQGNLMGPNHPMFGPRANDPYAVNPNIPFGGTGLPRGRVPGARFDPVGPPPPLNPARNNNNFGDELPPPGFDNMYL